MRAQADRLVCCKRPRPVRIGLVRQLKGGEILIRLHHLPHPTMCQSMQRESLGSGLQSNLPTTKEKTLRGQPVGEGNHGESPGFGPVMGFEGLFVPWHQQRLRPALAHPVQRG